MGEGDGDAGPCAPRPSPRWPLPPSAGGHCSPTPLPTNCAPPPPESQEAAVVHSLTGLMCPTGQRHIHGIRRTPSIQFKNILNTSQLPIKNGRRGLQVRTEACLQLHPALSGPDLLPLSPTPTKGRAWCPPPSLPPLWSRVQPSPHPPATCTPPPYPPFQGQAGPSLSLHPPCCCCGAGTGPARPPSLPLSGPSQAWCAPQPPAAISGPDPLLPAPCISLGLLSPPPPTTTVANLLLPGL